MRRIANLVHPPVLLLMLAFPLIAVVAIGGRATPAADAADVRAAIEFAASADAYIASGRPNRNFGAATGLFLGYNLADGYGAERVLVRFDGVGTIPAGSIINSARLRLFLGNSNPPSDVPMTTMVRHLVSSWTESEVTWSNQPARGDVLVINGVLSTSGWYEWDVTDAVKDWSQGTRPNCGFEIIGDESVQQRERVFYARETPTSLYPRLVVDYTAPSIYISYHCGVDLSRNTAPHPNRNGDTDTDANQHPLTDSTAWCSYRDLGLPAERAVWRQCHDSLARGRVFQLRAQ